MPTEVQRIPGTFTLPDDWPRVRLGSLLNMWGEWVGDDATPTDPAALSTGSPIVLPWSSRSGSLPLSAVAGQVAPNVAQNTAFGGHKYASFSAAAGRGIKTAALATPYSGPLTVTIHGMNQNGNDPAWLFHTGTGGAMHGLMMSNTELRLFSGPSWTSTTAAAITVPAPSGIFSLVACFNGADSYVRFEDTTATATIPAGGAASVVALGANGSGSGWNAGPMLNGRIAHARLYQRALTADEAGMTVDDYRATYA